MLATKRNTDNGNTKQQAENQVRKRYPDAAAKDPDNIKDSRKTAAGNTGWAVFNF